MRRIFVIATAILLAACANETSPSAADRPEDLSEALQGKRLLFLGAHPDDETVLMPIFAEACLFNGASCHFVNTAQAELGCIDTLGRVDFEACAALRMNELKASAAIVNGTTEVLGWQDLFYAHDGAGLRRNLVRWEQLGGGREALVDAIRQVLIENRPDVVFAIDPRHGSTCHPNHRATSLLLVEAVDRLPDEQRPRILFENTYTVFERMTPDEVEAVDLGAMFPWPDRDEPIIYYDATRILPNGRRAIDYQIDALRMHPSQFPELPEDASIDADPAQLLIPLVDLVDIDPTEELCTPLDLSEYKTIDRTLAYVGRKYAEIAERAGDAHAFRLTDDGEVMGAYGDLDAWPSRLTREFPEKSVQLLVAAGTMKEAEAAQAIYLQHVMRFVEAPE